MGQEGGVGLVPRHSSLEPGLGRGWVGVLRKGGGRPYEPGDRAQPRVGVGDLCGLAGVRHDTASGTGEVHGRVMVLQTVLNK